MHPDMHEILSKSMLSIVEAHADHAALGVAAQAMAERVHSQMLQADAYYDARTLVADLWPTHLCRTAIGLAGDGGDVERFTLGGLLTRIRSERAWSHELQNYSSYQDFLDRELLTRVDSLTIRACLDLYRKHRTS